MKTRFEFGIVGGGLLGASVAYALLKRGHRVVVVDAGDDTFKATRGNFGLIWTQTKGLRYRPYASLSRLAARRWTDFARVLLDDSGIDVGLQYGDGLQFCMSESEWSARNERMREQFQTDLPEADAYEMLRRDELIARYGLILGREVVGASRCKLDGAVNSLRLIRALVSGIERLGGVRVPSQHVQGIDQKENLYHLHCGQNVIACERVLLAAGLGNSALAKRLGLSLNIRPLRGQILVTERQPRFLGVPTHLIRQTDEGTVIIGDSKEDVGFDDGTTSGAMGDIAQRAIRVFPKLASARVVRAWGGLRIITPDGAPIYDRIPGAEGVFVANVHSGVTLAPVHAEELASSLVDGRLSAPLQPFRLGRFNAQAA